MGSLSPEQSASVLPMSSTTARRYTLLRRLAVGGMGELLLAHASSGRGVQKLVAIKRVRPEYASDPAFVSMFLNEARLAATLDHPNVVRTYDLVEDANGCFMVMEYLHGESLGRVQNEIAAAGLRVPLEHVVTIVLGVAAGLHCAHERRGVDGRPLDIVHRDLSPGNVFVTYEGGVKLLDFGIARSSVEVRITRPGTRKGKTRYTSPEQIQDLAIDGRSDVFSLGVILYELTTGRKPFEADNDAAAIERILRLPIPPPTHWLPGYPPALAAIVMRALAQDRDHRYASARALRDELERFAHDEHMRVSPHAVGEFVASLFGVPVESAIDYGSIPPPPSGVYDSPAFQLGLVPIVAREQRAHEPAADDVAPRSWSERSAIAIIVLASAVALVTALTWFW